ncbi:MAG: two-component system response regulator [Ectothiorhodospiraceae bacterium]|nr:two-component system response regulator [Ectothiorhodospiraceae bacterium]
MSTEGRHIVETDSMDGIDATKPWILVVDDERVVCDAIARQLRKAGYNTHVAYEGKEAIEILAGNRIDLALLDIRMPQTNGFDILKHIQKHTPETKSIMMTSYADIKSAVDSIAYGAVDIISKPVDLDEMILTIGKCFA